MNQVNIGESSSGLSVYPVKRRRGRPRKDPSLKHAGVAHVPAGFERAKQYLAQRADRMDGTNSMVGQTVTGVVEATFDAGYLLTVRIGGSATNLRGVVFKPGHYAPVTVENDVAPHLQMIRRNDVRFPAENQGWSHSQKLDIQAPGTVPPKRRDVSPKIAPSSAPPVGVRGTVVPVVLEPVNFPNGSTSQMHSNTSQSNRMMAFGDKDVNMVEPLGMLPPDRSIPASQIFLGTQAPDTIHQIEKHDSRPFNQGLSEVGQGANVKSMGSTDADNSSDASDNQTENSKEELLKSLSENSDFALKQHTGNTNQPVATEFSPTKSPLFSYGTGRMTELLQAVQENMKENQAQIAEQPTASKGEFHTNHDEN